MLRFLNLLQLKMKHLERPGEFVLGFSPSVGRAWVNTKGKRARGKD